MRINTNISALNTHRMLSQTNDAVARSIGRLSSGYRINNAKDDAAGLAIANRFRADIRSLRVAQQNTTEAGSMLQVAEGNATTISNILGRMKELATQAASYNASSQTDKLDQEFTELKLEIDRIVDAADYQGVKLLDGSFNGTFQIGATNDAHNQLAINLASGASTDRLSGQLGDAAGLGPITWGDISHFGALDGDYTLKITQEANDDFTFEILDEGGAAVATATLADAAKGANNTITLNNGDGDLLAEFTIDGTTFDPTDVNGADFSAGNGFAFFTFTPADPNAGAGLSTVDLGLDAIDLSDAAAAQGALTAIDSAIDTVNSFLGTIGATQNRLDYAAANIATTVENYSASESAIRDADMAFEMTTFTRNQIMQQAATAMLAQANMAPQGVLRLLG